jgi:hypothetical protein
MKSFCKILFILLFTFETIYPCSSQTSGNPDNQKIWRDCGLENVLDFKIFDMAVTGYGKIKNIKNKDIITIIDFSKVSSEKRCFVIDLRNKKLLYNCLVAHGKNTGENSAKSFSNLSGSLKSSLGFFLTAETYNGGNGYSLKLEGLEKGINDQARKREIVIHGAEYVSNSFIKKYGRLGRSWGCPALPLESSKEIIDTISKGSCLFIYAADDYYLKNSKLI